MGPQIGSFVVVTCFSRNRAPTNGENNNFDFGDLLKIYEFFIIFDFAYKRPTRIKLFRPRFHQNPQQPKFHRVSFRRSRPRGVAKREFGLPMLHGNQYLF